MTTPGQDPSTHRPQGEALTPGGDAPEHGADAALDPANQSLADALNVVFVFLRVVMVGLLLVFAFSGFQSVKENESGIRTLFGRVTGDNLPPGFHFAAPFPIGRLERVDVGAADLSLDREFWPALAPEIRTLPVDKIVQQTAKLSLKPGEDGSLVTGDQNIAHTRWRVTFTRAVPRQWIEAVGSAESERRIVSAAVQRGIVHAIAQVPIDDLLKQSATEEASVAVRAREKAQELLESMGTGIRIDKLTLQDRIPPLYNYNDFAGVQAAEQKASELRDKASTDARNTLNEMAGAAYEELIAQIDAYEAAAATNDQEGQARAQAAIGALLEGRPVTIGERQLPALISGRVTSIINDARQYRSTVANQARSELAMFKVRLEQYRVNPSVVIQRDWADALAEFMGRPNVETFMLPPGTDVTEIWVNRDPTVVRDLERARKEAEAKEGERRRMQEFERDRMRVNTDINRATSE